MLLIKNAKVYAPEYVGKKDLLVCGGKIECMEDKIEDFPIACEVIDAEERILTPGRKLSYPYTGTSAVRTGKRRNYNGCRTSWNGRTYKEC